MKEILKQVSLRNDYTVYEEGGAYIVAGENQRASGTNAGYFLRRSTTFATEPAEATSRRRGREA